MVAEAAPQIVRIKLHPKQIRFVADTTTPYLIFHGGRGALKTTAGAVKIVSRARFPGAREGLYRKNLSDLFNTTLKTILDGDGVLPPILPPGSYIHNQQRKTIKLLGGGEIVYDGLNKGESSRQSGSTGKGSSLNLTGACFEEWVEVTKSDMEMFDFSVRMKVPGLENQVYGMCNPGPPGHYLAERFGLSSGHVCREGHAVHHATIFDNPFIDDARKARLAENYAGVAYQRYILGKWVGSDGMVYDHWDRNIHAVDKYDDPKQVILGVDDGYNHPFVCLRVHIDSDGRAHVAREIYESKLIDEEKVVKVKDCLGDYKNAEVIVDSAAPSLIEKMRREGINARPCVKGADSVTAGIGIVQRRLVTQGDGLTRLTVAPGCTNTIREFETYEWKPRSAGAGNKDSDKLQDEPYDMNNHAMDALRYVCKHLDKGGFSLASTGSKKTKGAA